METSQLLSFVLAALMLTIMPGPDIVFVLTESLSKGQRNGITVAVGLGCGVMVHTLAAATGVSLILQQSETAFAVLKYAGSGYLFYLAYAAYQEKDSSVDINTSDKTHQKPSFSLIKKGFLTNVLNPKVSLFFIAFLPQFVLPTGWDMTLQMLVLGLIFMLQGIVVFSMVAVLSAKLTHYLISPKFWRTTRWCKIIVLTLLGIVMQW